MRLGGQARVTEKVKLLSPRTMTEYDATLSAKAIPHRHPRDDSGGSLNILDVNENVDETDIYHSGDHRNISFAASSCAMSHQTTLLETTSLEVLGVLLVKSVQ